MSVFAQNYSLQIRKKFLCESLSKMFNLQRQHIHLPLEIAKIRGNVYRAQKSFYITLRSFGFTHPALKGKKRIELQAAQQKPSDENVRMLYVRALPHTE